MAIKSFTRSTIENNIFYRSMLAGNTAYSPSSEDILAQEILTSAQATVTFSGLSAYAADYQHLQLRIAAKTSSGTGSSGNNLMTLNNDTGSNYAWHRLRGASDESTPASQAGATQSGIDWGFIPRDNSGNGSYAGYVIDILDPFETTKYTTTRCFWGFWQATVQYVGMNSGLWMNTDALTEIDFTVSGYSYAIGSSFTLIGVK